MTRLIAPGLPDPMGVTPKDIPAADGNVIHGVNVAVHAPNAEAIAVCLFDETGEQELEVIRLPGRTGPVHHGFIADVGIGARYGLRAFGPYQPERGHRFNPAKLLVDPFAARLDRPFELRPELFDQRIHGAMRDEIDSAPHVPKAIVEPLPNLRRPEPPIRRWGDLVIYELHVKGFTVTHPEIPADQRGTFAGLAHPAAIRHLANLGVTAVEIMPSAAWLDERHLPPLGLRNYWGYNPVTHFAPDPRLAPGGWPEVRAAVEALHAAGIAVFLDVVLNHTAESDHLGPTVSMRGLDNAAWYRLRSDDPSLYVNDAGCGNVLAAERPIAVHLMLETLRQWTLRAGIDGFRFDLAATIARGPNGFDRNHPFLIALAQDPVLSDRILIAEPWDIGLGGYQTGNFPTAWGEWNDRSRDTMRRFWRGDTGQIGDFTTFFAGSADVFGRDFRSISRSVNYVTAHDGFTLADLVAYAGKHNEANGEDNRDGTNDNISWNHGVEGPTDRGDILEARKRDMRGLLATLLLARGTPMLTMGDELGRTQSGNNNAYAQDNAISWLDWAKADEGLAAFVARVIAVRRAHPALTAETALTGRVPDGAHQPDVVWLNAAGQPMGPGDWSNPDQRFFAGLFGAGATGRVLVLINVAWHDQDVTLPLPEPHLGWFIDLDSAAPEHMGGVALGAHLTIAARSVVVLREAADAAWVEPIPEPELEIPAVAPLPGPVAPPPEPRLDQTLLDRLAQAAGIQPDWWDIAGRHVSVSDATKRAILASMGYACDSDAEIRASLALLVRERFARALPVTIVADEGEPVVVTFGGALVRATQPVKLEIRREDGSKDLFVIPPRGGEEVAIEAPDGSTQRVRRVRLAAQPIGRHRLVLPEGADLTCHLIVCPAKCYLPEDLGGEKRGFGVAAHLYALRRAGDQGIGDFTTLARFAELAANVGAVTIGFNPLHAMFPGDRERASPYGASDRRFIDPIYIDVTQLPPTIVRENVRTALFSEGRTTSALSSLADVDYTRVWQSKKKVLDVAFQVFEQLLAGTPTSALVQDFDAFVDAGGIELQRFAEFHAIAEEVGHPNWREWPENVRSSIRRDKLETAIRFQNFLQWLADRQFAAAAHRAKAAGLKHGFYRDLAVGSAPDGAESWGERNRLMIGLSVGAPPDPFSANGQVWNLPPPNPRFMNEGGYQTFTRLIASNMAYAGAVRIDHAMGLRRLFVVPDGMTGAEGAYVDMPFEDMLRILALESQRAKCIVVGEDLGTVPEGFREALAAADVLAYRVLWFEREGEAFASPERYPQMAAACVSTHDLATLNGWWIGADISENVSLGLVDPQTAQWQREARGIEKALLLDLLVSSGFLPERPDPAGPLQDATVVAVHALVAAAPSVLALAQAEELTGEIKAVNLPGTDRERPNWRRKLAPDIAQMFDSPLARAIFAAMRATRGG